MRYNAIDKIKKIGCSPFITVIGRGGAGVPVLRIEAVVEYNNSKVVKTLVDESKIKSLIILDSGEIHPSTFHYNTIKQRCEPYITLVTTVGCDGGGMNVDKINLIVDYKVDNSHRIIDELLSKFIMRFTYEDIERTKSIIISDSNVVYPCTFNYSTIRRRIHILRGDEVIPQESEEDI